MSSATVKQQKHPSAWSRSRSSASSWRASAASRSPPRSTSGLASGNRPLCLVRGVKWEEGRARLCCLDHASHDSRRNKTHFFPGLITLITSSDAFLPVFQEYAKSQISHPPHFVLSGHRTICGPTQTCISCSTACSLAARSHSSRSTRAW